MKFVYTKQFQRDIKKAQSTLLIPKIERLIEIVRRNPFQNPPPYEKLSGYENWYSRRVNEQHRLVYILNPERTIFVSCWGHYE